MKNVCKRTISLIVIFCFIFNIISLDRAYSFTIDSSKVQDNLAVSSSFDDLTGIEHKDISNITLALQANLLSSEQDVIDVASLKEDLLLEENTVFNPANMHFVFSGEGMKTLPDGRVRVKCKVKNKGTPLRIYYVVFSTIKQGEGFPMEVYAEREWVKLREDAEQKTDDIPQIGKEGKVVGVDPEKKTKAEGPAGSLRETASNLLTAYISFRSNSRNEYGSLDYVNSFKGIFGNDSGTAISRLITEGKDLIAKTRRLTGRRKRSLIRNKALHKLEKMLIDRLEKQDSVVVNLMGRLGAGKTTIANVIGAGIDGVKPSEIMIVHSDQFLNQVDVINELLRNRAILNKPVSRLTVDESRRLSDIARKIGMHWPDDLTGPHTFMNYYAKFRLSQEGFGTTDVTRNRTLMNLGLAHQPINSLSTDEMVEIRRLASEYGIKRETLEKHKKHSLWAIYTVTERNEFFASVEKDEPATTPLRLFVVEGLYSYQGEALFDAEAERLDSDVSVFVEVDEATRRERIKRRGRLQSAAELAEMDIFDVIFAASVDAEREKADIILDNNRETNEYQIVTLPSGDKVQFGISTETTKDMMRREMLGEAGVPDIFVLPPELFHGGRNFADIEFVVYYNLFLKKGKRITIVGTSGQIENLKVYMQHSLFGPERSGEKWFSYSEEERAFFDATQSLYPVFDLSEMKPITDIDKVSNFIPFDNGQVTIKQDGRDILIKRLNLNTFSASEKGSIKEEIVEIDYRTPSTALPKIRKDLRDALSEAPKQRFSVMPLGTSHGFDMAGDFTSFIIWIEGKGILVDPSPQALDYIDSLGIDQDTIPYVLLTHTHADHDGGLLRKLLTKRRVNLIAARPVYDSFVAKAQVLVGNDYDVTRWMDYIELTPGHGNELALPLGAKKKAVVSARWNLHSIPTIGFKISYGNYTVGYSGDIEYAPEKIDKLLEDDKITKEQAYDLKYFFWNAKGEPTVDILYHEAGMPPIHTPSDTLAGLPAAVKEIMHLVHIADKDVPGDKGLNKARAFKNYILIESDEQSRLQMIVEKVNMASMVIAGLTPEKRYSIIEEGEMKTFNKGDVIIREGDEVNETSEFYIILSGRTSVEKGGEKIWQLGPGDVFGERGLEKGIPRTASIVAMDTVQVIALNGEQYKRIISNPELGEEIDRQMENLELLEEWVKDTSESLTGDLSTYALKHLSARLKRRTYKKGDDIVIQGETGSEFFIIKSGEVDIIINQNGQPNKVAARGVRSHFGEIALLEKDAKRTATVRAASDVEVIVLNKDDFDYIMYEFPGLDYAIRKTASERKNGISDVPESEVIAAREKARRPDGKFGKQQGKSTDDAWKLVCSSPWLANTIKARGGFAKDDYITAWKKAYPEKNPPADSTVFADLDGLLEEYKDRSGEEKKGYGYLTKEIQHGKAWYFLTDKGKAVRMEDSLALREEHNKMVERESEMRKGPKDLVKVDDKRTMPIHTGELSDQPKLPAAISETVASVVQAKYGGDRLVTATMRNQELVNGLLQTESFHDKDHLRQVLINAGFADPTADMKRDVRHFVQTVDARNPEAAAPQVVANVLLDRGSDEDSRALMTFANEVIKYTDPELSENLEGLLKASREVQLKCFKWLFERIIKEAEAAYNTDDHESQSKHILVARLILKHINRVISDVDDKNWVALRTHILMTFAERISAEWRGEKKGLMAVFMVLYPDISREFFLSVDRNFTVLTELTKKDEAEKLFKEYGGYEMLARSFETLLSFSCLAWSDHNDEKNFFDYLVSRYKHASKNVKAHYLAALRFGIIPRKITGEIYDVEDVREVAKERLLFVLENTVDLASEKSPIIQKKVKDILINLPSEFVGYMGEDSRYMGLDYTRRLLLSEILLQIAVTESIREARGRVLPFIMYEVNLPTEDNIEIHKKIFGCNYFTSQLIENLSKENGKSVRSCIMEGYHELKTNDLTAKNCIFILAEFGMPSITEAYDFFRHRISLDYDKAVGVLYLAGHVASAFQAETTEDKKAIDRMARTVMQHALDSTRTKREAIKAYDVLREKISRTYRDLEGLEKQVQEVTEANSELTAQIKDLKDEKTRIKEELFFLDRMRQHLFGTVANASLLINNITATYLTFKAIIRRLPLDIMKALGFFNKLKDVELPDPGADKKTYDEQVRKFIEDTKPERNMPKVLRANGAKEIDLHSEETFMQDHSIREWLLIRRRMRQRLAEKHSNLSDMESDIWEKNKRLGEIDEEMGDLQEKQVEIARDYVEIKNEYDRKSRFLKHAEEKVKPAAQAKMEESFKITKDLHSVLRLFLAGPSTSREVVSETARVFTGGAAIESTSRMLPSGKEETDKKAPDKPKKADDEEEIIIEEGKSDGEVILTLLALSKDKRFSELVSIDAVKELLAQHLEYQSRHGIFKEEVIAEMDRVIEFLLDGTLFPKESEDKLVQKIKKSMWDSLKRLNQMEASAAVAERLDKTRAKVKAICDRAIENVRAGAGTADALVDYMEAFLDTTVKNETAVRRLIILMVIISNKFGCNAAIEAIFSRLSGVAGKYFIRPKDAYYEVKTVDEWDSPEEGLVKGSSEDGRVLVWEYEEKSGRKVKDKLVSIEEDGIVTTYRWDAPSPMQVVMQKGDGDPKIRKYRFAKDGRTRIIYALNPAELVMEEYRDYFRAIQLLKKTVYECQQESHKVEEGYGWDTEANDAGLRYFVQLFNSEHTSQEVKSFAEKMLYLSVFQEWINTWKVQKDPLSRTKIQKLNIGFSSVLGAMAAYLENAPKINIEAAQMEKAGNHTPVWVVEMSYRLAKRVCGIFESKQRLNEKESEHALKVLERMEEIIADDVIIVEEGEQGDDVERNDEETGVYVKIAIREALLHLRKNLKIYVPPSQKVLPSSTINLRLPFSTPGQGVQSALTEGDIQDGEAQTTKQSVIGDIFKDPEDAVQEESTKDEENVILDQMETLAQEAGIELSRPILDKNYTLVTCDNFYKDEDEYKEDILEYGSIFNLKRIKPAAPEAVVTRILDMIKTEGLDPNNVIVQLPKVFGDERMKDDLEKLVNDALGIKFMIIDTEGLKEEDNSAEYRRNIYSMMLLARHIDKDTQEDSKVHMLLSFLIGSIVGEENKDLISGYIDALIRNDITSLVKTILTYKPMEKYDAREEYHNIAKTLISA